LGFRYIDDSVIVEKASAWGGDPDKMRAILAGPPTILARVTHHPRIQFALLQAALADEVREGRCVCYGEAADLLALNAPNVMRVRVECPQRNRLALAERRLAFNPAEAEEQLRACDQAERRRNSYLYGTSADLPFGYDLRIDLGATSAEEACGLVCYVIDHHTRYKATEAALATAAEFALTTRVRATLAANPQTSHLDLAVVVHDRSVALRGSVRLTEEMALVRSVVQNMLGVTTVDITEVWPGTWDYVLGPLLLPPVATSDKTASNASPRAVAPARVKRLRLEWAIVGTEAVVVLLLSAVMVQAGFWAKERWVATGHELQTFTGLITDSHCAGNHSPSEQSAACVRACVRQNGAKYALWDGTHVYVISDQQAGDRFAGRAVVVRGSLDRHAGNVQIHSIASAPKPPPEL
jgi:cytidylate kinase